MNNKRGGIGILGTKLLEKFREKKKDVPPEESIESVWAKKYESGNNAHGDNRPEGLADNKADSKDESQNQAKKDYRDIVIGFDFGTASTKVVIQDTTLRHALAVPLRRALAVPFSLPARSINEYLLPTKVFRASNGSYTLEPQDKAFHDLKIRFMDNAINGAVGDEYVNAAVPCAAYIALVLQDVKKWFLTSQGDIYRNSEINWWLNVGMPSKSYDETPVKKAFLQIARVGWLLSSHSESVSDALVRQALSRTNAPASGLNEQINVYPEVAAEVTGYARSDARQAGLHLMVDVGAGTLDVSTFILSNDEGEDIYSFLEVDVTRQGTFYLHKFRLEQLFKAISNHFDALDMTKPIPGTCGQMLPPNDDLTAIDDDFMIDCVGTVNGAVVRTKGGRAPDEEQFDRKGPKPLPVFLCGGGSQVGLYQRLISTSHARISRNYNVGEYAVRHLPMPQAFQESGVEAKDFHRLAVAYGLSFTILDLGRVIPPSEIEDIPMRPIATDIPEMVTKDQV